MLMGEAAGPRLTPEAIATDCAGGLANFALENFLDVAGPNRMQIQLVVAQSMGVDVLNKLSAVAEPSSEGTS